VLLKLLQYLCIPLPDPGSVIRLISLIIHLSRCRFLWVGLTLVLGYNHSFFLYRNIEADMNTRPEITISSIDSERLYALMASLPSSSFLGKDELESELARANVVEPAEVPPTVVTMNSTVRFSVESSHDE